MKKIVLINGKKRHGKDFLAEKLRSLLVQQNKTVEIMSFAGPIKGLVSTVFDIGLDELDDYKNDETGIYNACGEEVSNFRKVLQRLGTEAMPIYFGKNVWVDLLKSEADKSNADIILVPDFRFPNEHIEGALTVKIFNDDIISTDTHASENSLNDFVFDIVINNTGRPDISKDVRAVVSAIDGM